MREENKYKGNEHQCPSYTDRILYKITSPLKYTIFEYLNDPQILGRFLFYIL